MKQRYFIYIISLCALLFSNNVRATINKTIGATGDYATITAAWAAIPGIESPITQPWVFLILSDYNPASETIPIDLTAINGASSTNTITIQLNVGVTGITISTGSASSVFKFNGADYVILDGRAAGAGASELTIENTQTASLKHAIKLTADATNNIIRYCTIKGSSYNSAQIQSACVISIDEGNATTNCDNTTISNCTITKSGVNKPSSLLGIGRNTVAITLDGLTLSNNDFVDFDNAAIYSPWPIASANITNNSFYQSASWGDLVVASYGIYLMHTSNADITITGNFIGGQAANAGGAVMAITSVTTGYNFTGIRISSYVSSSIISSNTIQNLALTQSASGNATNGIICIEVSGTSNFTIGSSGNPNTIGANTGTGSIVVAGAVQAIFKGIIDGSTGTNSIAYNTIGAISVTAVTGTFLGIGVTSTATTTIANNTIGSTQVNNIVNSADAASDAIKLSSTGSYTVTNNTIQQFSLTGGNTSTEFNGIYLSTNGTITASGNAINNITSNGVKAHYGIRVSSTGTCVVSSNNIGSASSNNMALSGDIAFYAIAFTAAGSFTCNSNTIQQFNLTGAGSSTTFNGIRLTAGTLSDADGNAIKNITSNGTNSGTSGTIGIYVSANNNHSITTNSLQDFTTSNQTYGIYLVSTGTCTVSFNVIGGSSSNNMACSYNGIAYGIQIITGAGTFTCNSNTIQQFNLTNAGSSTAFQGIVATAGTLTATSDTIKNISSLGTSSSATTASIGIYASANTNHSITQNTLQGFAIAGMFNGIYVASTGTVTVSSNTIGSAAGNNMTLSGNYAPLTGIFFNTSGTLTCSSNTIQNFNCTSDGSTNKFAGIYINAGTATISLNTITTIASATKATASTTTLGVNGVYLVSGGNTVNSNIIDALTTSSTGGAYSVAGINSNNGSGTTNTITKNKITGLGVGSTTASSIVAGLYLQGAGNYNVYNNIILLNNGVYVGNSIVMSGIRNSATGTIVIYHNTVKLYGTATSNSGSSSAYRNGGSNTVNIQNNVFQNVITNSGGTGKHYAFNYATLPSAVTAEDYNYIEASGTGGVMGAYSGDRAALSDWKTASSTGATDYTASITIDASGYVTNGTALDVQSNGANLSGTVSTDYSGTARAAAPWRGAFESAAPLPIELLSFTANYSDYYSAIELSWVTATETNNDYFTIDRTTNGKEFEFVKNIKGAGNSNQILSYTEIDFDPIIGLSYYRLKQTDYDGHFEYFPLVPVYYKKANNFFDFIVYPNPYLNHSDLKVKLNGDKYEEILIVVQDILGKVYFSKILILDEEEQTIGVDLNENLIPGIYFVIGSSLNSLYSKKLVVQ